MRTNKEEQPANYYYNAYTSKLNPTHFFYKKKIDTILSFISHNKKILDAGCGSGVLIWLATTRKNCKSTGVDISKKEIEFCKKVTPNAKFKLQDIRKLNLNDQFEVINCSDVIEHLREREREYTKT